MRRRTVKTVGGKIGHVFEKVVCPHCGMLNTEIWVEQGCEPVGVDRCQICDRQFEEELKESGAQ